MYKSKICANCNGNLTQPYDLAWQTLVALLKARFSRGDCTQIPLHDAFPGSVHKSMLDVHLYFLKQFGCYISDGNVPIDMAPFADALRNTRAHPDVFLAFIPNPRATVAHQNSDMETFYVNKGCVCAAWFYITGCIKVKVVYAVEGGRGRALLDGVWHPNTISKLLKPARC